MDGRLVVEEYEDVVEAGAEFVGKNSEFGKFGCHGYDVLLDHDKTLAREPYDFMVESERWGVASRIEFAEATGSDEFLGQQGGEAEDFIEI